MKRFFLVFTIVGLIFWLGCEKKAQEVRKQGDQVNPNTKMAIRVQALLKTADPKYVSYFSSQRAGIYEKLIGTSNDINEAISIRLIHAYELINGGDNDQAVMKLEQLLEEFKSKEYNAAAVYEVKRLTALAYMRLGEVENCVNRNGDASCIFPINSEGQYTIKRGVEAAIRLYREMLEERPDDKESIWMLNFAYMTLGQYPEKVPSAFLLPPNAFKSDEEFPRFKNVAGKLGVNTLGISGGVCIEDFNRDGYLDIISSSWDLRNAVRLFFNNGDGTFSDVTVNSGLGSMPGGLNMIHGDYNNDGWVDVLILRGSWMGPSGQIPNSLLKNNGDGTFTDVTAEAGLLSFHPTQTAVWADFNLDGHLDLFVANESTAGSLHQCEFYINNGDGTFINRINQAGISNLRGFYKGVVAGDVNNDGYPDIYLSNLEGPNQLLISELKDGKTPIFNEVGKEAGVQEPINSFPAWFWDYNQDGLLDLFVVPYQLKAKSEVAAMAVSYVLGQMKGGQPMVYQNTGQGKFREVSAQLGLDEVVFCMGANYGDIDNDGFPDMYLGTGDPSYTSVVPNKMYRNVKGEKFSDITTTTGLGHVQKGHAVAFADIDADGDQDIFCVLGGAFEGDVYQDALFLNPISNAHKWLNIRLKGKTANADAIGAKLELTVVDEQGNKKILYEQVSTGGSFGASSLAVEWGLADAVQIESLKIIWPNQNQDTDVYENVPINQFIVIEEGAEDIEVIEINKLDFES